MASIQSLLEDYRNWIKTQEWKNKKQDERLFGGDPVLQEEFEKWSGGFSPSNLGSGLSGLAGAIGRSTVKSPFRKAFPGIYDNPRDIVNASAEMVAPENRLMQELFGVTRADLDAMTRAKAGKSSVDVPVYQPTARAAKHVENITKPANTKRVASILELASEDPRFAGSYGWYESQPLLNKYIDMFGAEEGMKRFRQHHALGAALSPATDVNTEIRRASIANQLLESGKLEQFINKSAVPAGAGHAYHATAHAAGLKNLLETGNPFPESLQQAPKVRNYFYSRTGENTAHPTIDAHMARQIGLADVRPTADFGSIGAAENLGVRNWFNRDVAAPIGMEGSPAQALLWNAAGKQSGVETALGAPYLELLTGAIQRQSARSGKSPQTVLDEFLAGKGHLW